MSTVQIFADVGLNNNDILGDAQGQTAQLGDNDKSLATTEFVQGVGLKFGNSVQATGAATLDSTFLGKLIYLTGVSPYTITLPDNSLFLSGSAYSFSSHTDATITISAPQSIITKNGTTSSINVTKGDSFTLTKKTTGEWILYGSWGAASGSFQPLNDNLTGISGLNVGGNGVPKKTGAGNWIWDTNTYLTANQNITVSGDASGSGTTAIALTLANSGVAAGTYQSVTVDTKGRVTAGTNPTTLSGFGITDAVNVSSLGAANGVATLDATGLLTSAQRPIATSTVLGMVKVGSNLTIDGSGILNFNSNLTLSGRTTGSGKFLFGNKINDPNIANCWVDGVNSGLTADRVFTMIDTNAVMKVVRVSTDADPSFELQSWDDTLTTCRGYWDVVVFNGDLQFRDRTGVTTDIYLSANRSANTLTTPRNFSAANFSGSSSGTNTGDQTITLTGDVTGSGTGTFATTLSNSGVAAGTYKSVTVDAKGRVTAGTNPTTLAGYGITDAAPLSHVSDTSLHLTSAQNTWIDAITASSTEVNYLVGVTSPIQTQLNNKQTLDSELSALAALPDSAGYIRKTGNASYIVDTTMPVISTLIDGQPAFIEPLGGKTVSIETFELDFGLSSAGTRNVYLQFGDDISSSATVGQRLPHNMTLVGIYAQCTSVGSNGATAEVRVNGAGTSSASCPLVSGTNIYNYTTHSINFNAGDRIALYGAAPTNNWANMSVKLIFRWRD